MTLDDLVLHLLHAFIKLTKLIFELFNLLVILSSYFLPHSGGTWWRNRFHIQFTKNLFKVVFEVDCHSVLNICFGVLLHHVVKHLFKVCAHLRRSGILAIGKIILDCNKIYKRVHDFIVVGMIWVQRLRKEVRRLVSSQTFQHQLNHLSN